MTAAIREDTPQLRIKPAPRREPPFDDELGARHLVIVGPLDRPLPFETDLHQPSGYRLAQYTDQFEVQPTSRTDLPAIKPFARQFVIGVIEAATGRRPASQLRWHTSPSVQAGIARDAGKASRLGSAQHPGRLHSVHVFEPADGVAEVAAVIQIGVRFRALALRLEGLDGRWRCVRLQIG